MRGATGVTIQPHQILRLSRRKTHILSPHHIWNVIYSARSNRCHDPTSPNTAPATKNDSTALSSSHMKRHLQCAEQQVSRSNLTKYCACHAERLAYLVLITYETSFTLRAATGVTIQPHQILRLSRRKTHILSPHRIWNVIYSARSNRCHHPTSPNTAPATKNDSTALSSSHMKRHFQCAEQQVSLSNLTKYCACHEKWHCKISKKISKNRWNVISNAGPIRPWSDHDPRMIRAWKRKPQPASQPRLLFELTTSIFYWKIQRFAPNLTFKPSPNTAPATKSATWTSPNTAPATKSDTWTSPSTAPATKSDTWTSPSTAPATKSDTWTSPNTAPATKSDTWTSPNTAPAMKSNTWLYLTLFYLTLLYLTLLYLTLLYLTLLYLTLFYLTLLYLTLFFFTLFYLTLLYLTLLYLTLLCLTLLYLTLLYLTLLYLALFYLTLLYVTLLYLTLLYLTLFYLTLLYVTLLYLTLLYLTLFYLTLLYVTLLYLTLLYLTLFYLTLLYLTLFYLTLLYLTLFYLTLLYLTLLYLT